MHASVGVKFLGRQRDYHDDGWLGHDFPFVNFDTIASRIHCERGIGGSRRFNSRSIRLMSSFDSLNENIGVCPMRRVYRWCIAVVKTPNLRLDMRGELGEGQSVCQVQPADRP